jgi:hypothetical protein
VSEPDSLDSQQKTPPLTVVMVNYHCLADIEARLRASTLAGHDVIVVDNGDDPAGVRQACDAHGARPLLLDHNVGFAAAVNRAVVTVEVPGRPWLLLNPDVELSRDQLSALATRLGSRTGVAPVLTNTEGRLQVGVAGGRVTLGTVAAYFLFVSHLVPRVRGLFLTRRQASSARDVDWLCMACLLLAADAFERFGPIPETELVYAEDIAWGTSASGRGAHFEVVPDVRVRHVQGGSGASALWVGAVERLCRARMGPIRGRLAIVAIRAGLVVRRIVGRSVT